MIESAIVKLLWAFRFPIVCLLLVGALAGGWKAWSYQADKTAEQELIAETAIAEHDRVIKQAQAQAVELVERERLRIERERENAKLWNRLDKILQDAASRQWAAVPVPDAIRRLRDPVSDGLPNGVPPRDPGAAVLPGATTGTSR
jgi:hypothetical protein